jgi:hypothetical protein
VSADARHAGLWIPGSADRRGMPFAIVDRNDARIYVFEASGRLSSASSALLGQARGDHSAPGVGERTQAGAVPPHERTTPSCRFMSEPDAISMASRSYGSTTPSPWPFAAFARVRARLAREARLSSGTPGDDRVSLGCLVGPEPFYSEVVQPLMGRRRVRAAARSAGARDVRLSLKAQTLLSLVAVAHTPYVL